MGEAKTNPVAIAKREGKLVNPISVESILIITDLAQIGLAHLNQLLPEMKSVVEKGDAAITPDQLRKFEELTVDGPEVIAHFSNICQYIRESARAGSDSGSEGAQ